MVKGSLFFSVVRKPVGSLREDPLLTLGQGSGAFPSEYRSASSPFPSLQNLAAQPKLSVALDYGRKKKTPCSPPLLVEA